MSQKLKSTAPWLILPAIVIALTIIGLLPPSQQVAAEEDVQNNPVDSVHNPKPKKCCACFEEELKITYKDSTGAANLARKGTDVECYNVPVDKNGEMKFTVEVELKPDVEGCEEAMPEVRVVEKGDMGKEVSPWQEGFSTDHEFGIKDGEKYEIQVRCKNGSFSQDYPCPKACVAAGCGCSDGECDTGVCALDTESGSPRTSFPLGTASQGDAGGLKLEYYTDTITNPGVSALMLWAPNDGSVITTRDAQGNIATVKTGNIHAAIVTVPTTTGTFTDSKAFEIRKSTDLANPVTTANAFRITRVANTAADKLRFTTTFNGATTSTEYHYDQATNTWTRTEGITAAKPAGLRKTTLIITDGINIRTYRRTVTEIPAAQVTSDIETTYTYFPWGQEMTKRVIDPDDKALTSTWDYYEPGEVSGINGGTRGYGKLQSFTRHDGYEETHLYDLYAHTIFLPYAGNSGALVETRHYNPPAKILTITRQVGFHILSKTVTEETSPTVTKTRTYTDTDNFLETVTEYYPTGQDFGGQIKKITRPDGTVTIKNYTRNGNEKETTTWSGVPNGTTVAEGTLTVTKVNQSGKLTETTTTAVGTGAGTILDHRLVMDTDPFGRPLKTAYHNGAYFTERTYGCCGVVTETDRTGIKTHYAYDAIRRTLKTNRLGITNETRYLGLTTSSYRYPETGSVAEVGNPSGIPATETSRASSNLAGTERKQWTLTAKDGTLILASEAITTYLNPAHTTPATLPAGIGMKSVTKAAQAADDPTRPQQTTEAYLDGKTYQTYGDLSPHMRYSYAVAATGQEASRSYVDGADLRETVTTRADLAGRTTATLYAGGATATAHYNAKGQMVRSVDPDGVTSLYAYNSEGQRTTTALDLDPAENYDDEIDNIDYSADQITFSETDPVTAHGEACIRTISKVWQHSNIGSYVVAHSDRAVTGLRSWSIRFPSLANADERTSENITTLLGNGNVTSKSIAPDNSYTLQTTTAGLAAKTESFDSGDTLIASTIYQTYDSRNRPTHIKDSRYTQASVTAYVNDVTDAVASVTDAAGNTTSFTYDVRDRRVTTDAPDTLDAAGATLANITTNHYFASGQTKETVGAQTYRRTYTYDYAQRMKTLTTYGTNTATTEWKYDTSRGWLTEKNYSGETGNGPGNAADYTYTSAGRLATRTWERGVTTTYHYDTAGRQDKITYSDTTPQVDYIYDRLSRPRFAIQGAQLTGTTVNVTEYTYRTDNLTLETEVTVEGPYDATANTDQYTSSQNFKRTLDRSVDNKLRPTGWILKDAASVTEHSAAYGYDASTSRLATVTGHSQTHTYGYTYTATTTPDTRQGDTNGLSQDYIPYIVSSPAHTVTNTYERNRNILLSKESSATSSLSKAAYQSNAIGQRTNATHSGLDNNGAATRAFGYNSSGELTGATTDNTNFDRVFAYDGIGNRTTATVTNPAGGNSPVTATYAPDALNQYDTVTTAGTPLTPVHDPDGNMTSGPLPAHRNANSTLAWDAENRLVSVTVNGTTTTYGYDFQSRRTRKTTGASVTRFVYDGWNLITEYTGTTLKRSYTWGMDLSGSMQGAGGVGGLLSIREATGNGSVKAGQTLYPTYDGNGNITRILDSSSNVVCSYGYDPFGNFENPTGNDADSSGYATEQPFGFSTKYRDAETALYYYGYRYYDPVTGRWPSRDPIEERGGINVYGFVSNSGVNGWDVLGNAPRVTPKLTGRPGYRCKGDYLWASLNYRLAGLERSKNYMLTIHVRMDVSSQSCSGGAWKYSKIRGTWDDNNSYIHLFNGRFAGPIYGPLINQGLEANGNGAAHKDITIDKKCSHIRFFVDYKLYEKSQLTEEPDFDSPPTPEGANGDAPAEGKPFSNAFDYVANKAGKTGGGLTGGGYLFNPEIFAPIKPVDGGSLELHLNLGCCGKKREFYYTKNPAGIGLGDNRSGNLHEVPGTRYMILDSNP